MSATEPVVSPAHRTHLDRQAQIKLERQERAAARARRSAAQQAARAALVYNGDLTADQLKAEWARLKAECRAYQAFRARDAGRDASHTRDASPSSLAASPVSPAGTSRPAGEASRRASRQPVLHPREGASST